MSSCIAKWWRARGKRALTWINVNLRRPTHFPCIRAGEVQMESDMSDLIIGLMMALFGLIGLFLVAGAMDAEMYVFGLALTGFAVVFDFGLIKRRFDRQDAALAASRNVSHV
jgi:hypothetical protein